MRVFLCFISFTVLQQAGLNPSLKTLGAYWTPGTVKLNFDDFCEILKKEKPIDKNEVLKAFRKMDPDGSGYISHGDLYIVLTSVSNAKYLAVNKLADSFHINICLPTACLGQGWSHQSA